MQKLEFLRKLGGRVRVLRIEKELTQTQLAHEVNKDQQSIQRLENGKINPSAFYLFEIAQGLEVPVKTLLDIEKP
jgi:putative transcriptional regulator